MKKLANFNAYAAYKKKTHTSFGENSLICCSNNVILLPAASATTSISFCSLTISSVCVPIEPVEPKIAIFFIQILFSKQLVAKRRRESQILGGIFFMPCHQSYLFCSETNSRAKNKLSSLFFTLISSVYNTIKFAARK